VIQIERLPTGSGDAHYDFWSPLLISYTNVSWQAAVKAWPNTCKEALRFGIVKAKKNKGKKGMMDLGLFNDELYRQFLGALDGEDSAEMSGISCFLNEDGGVFHTYSTFARGTEFVGNSYTLLDLTVLGRQEDWEEPKGRVPAVRRGDPTFLS